MDCERTMEPVTPASKILNLSVLPAPLREALAEFAHGTASAGEMAQRLSSLRRTAPR